MRIIVFFDLPVVSSLDKKNYVAFRKFLITNGFAMMQQSVYTKLVLNYTSAKAVTQNIRKHAPPSGLVQMLVITEKQFNDIEYVIGENTSELIQTDDKLVVI